MAKTRACWMSRAVLLAVVATAFGCGWPSRALRGYARAEADGLGALEEGGAFAHAPRRLHGQVRFVFDDFGSLNTDELETYSIPWKLVTAALVRTRVNHSGAPVTDSLLRGVMSQYGFISPRRIANWEGQQPHLSRPLGIVSGIAHRGFPAVDVEIANIGCATCHAGVLHGPDGFPTGDVWLGLPNSSLDLSAFADAVLTALARELERPDTLLAAISALDPEVSDLELNTLRRHVIPRARKQLAERATRYGGLLPFENGGAGLMNGVGSMRFLVGALHGDARANEIAWTSPPDLSGTTLRRALLIDGIYAPPGADRFGALAAAEVSREHLDALAGVASLFVSSTQGITPASAREAIPRVRDVMEFLHALDSPRFPGPVDATLAENGRAVYDAACVSCHGAYSDEPAAPRLLSHPNRLATQDRMRTDSVRWSTVDTASLQLMAELSYEGLIDAVASGGYVAPDLSGVWATAPYLHNGSVPTLWHLLHAEERPVRFQVGGHALDYELMGIAGERDEHGTYRYHAGYEPWSKPFLYDTREPGRSNQGHEFRTLSDTDKRALLEYLKLL